jgi:catechol 2,3-dioxygenase-like lactoylglutathione lyase family enzyme
VRFHHVQLAMPPGGEAAARRFYGEVLGLEEVPKPGPLAARGGCWFRRGDVELHLGVDDAFTPARKAHPAIVVEDLAEVELALADAGAEVIIDAQLDGFRRIHTFDPFGNRLELLEARA